MMDYEATVPRRFSKGDLSTHLTDSIFVAFIQRPRLDTRIAQCSTWSDIGNSKGHYGVISLIGFFRQRRSFNTSRGKLFNSRPFP